MTARKTVTNVDVLALKSMVQLAAFASEAQRILKGIDWAAKINPEIEQGIRAYVTASANWTSFEAPIAEVLSHVASEMERLDDDIEAAEGGKQ